MSEAADELRALARRAFAAPFEGVIRVEPAGEPAFEIDGWASPPTVADADGGAADGGAAQSGGRCVLRASRETLLRVLESEKQFAGAFVSGRLAVGGDMSVLARAEIGS